MSKISTSNQASPAGLDTCRPFPGIPAEPGQWHRRAAV